MVLTKPDVANELIRVLTAIAAQPPPGMKAHRFVGLDRDVWLPANYEVFIRIVDKKHRNVRSLQRAVDQVNVTIHSTGNFALNADAFSEANYLEGGAGGRAVGYNFTVHHKNGRKVIVQHTPLNEVSWAAGTERGNRLSWHIEKAVGALCDFEGTNVVAATLAGALCVAKGLDPVRAIVQHNVWYGKNCPQLVRERNRWQAIVSSAATHARAIVNAVTKPPVVTTPVDAWPYAEPVPIKSLIMFENLTQDEIDTAPQELDGITMVFDTYEVVTETKRLRYMWNRSEETGPTLKPKQRVKIVGIKFIESEEKWYGVTPAPYWTRVDLDDCRRVSDGFLDAA